jgi:hypothetical protein
MEHRDISNTVGSTGRFRAAGIAIIDMSTFYIIFLKFERLKDH